jgi:hypothetical protein
MNIPQTVETPLHTIDALRAAMKTHAFEGMGQAMFVSVDCRVLAWLCRDAETLNHLVSAELERA